MLQDIKFPLSLDVFELCTIELQQRLTPARDRFKAEEDKRVEIAQMVTSSCVVTWLLASSFWYLTFGLSLWRESSYNCRLYFWMFASHGVVVPHLWVIPVLGPRTLKIAFTQHHHRHWSSIVHCCWLSRPSFPSRLHLPYQFQHHLKASSTIPSQTLQCLWSDFFRYHTLYSLCYWLTYLLTLWCMWYMQCSIVTCIPGIPR